MSKLFNFSLIDSFRYQVIYRLGQTCTALLINHTHPNELFVATVDLNVHCIDIGQYDG